MWTTVLLLALALNLEPTRIGLLPLLLSRPRPALQLAAFLAGSMTMTLLFGFLVLFVFHRVPFASTPSSGGWVQIALGAAALLIGAAMALRWLVLRRRPPSPDHPSPAAEAGRSPRAEKMMEMVQRVLRKGQSPWLAALVGVGGGLPSPDYVAILIVIATSRASRPEQAAALLVFLILGSLVLTAPLIGYLAAPAETQDRIDRFARWARSRSQVEYAAHLGLIGVLLMVLGYTHL